MLTRIVLGLVATAAVVVGAAAVSTQAETGSTAAALVRLGAAVVITLVLIAALSELAGVEWGGRRR